MHPYVASQLARERHRERLAQADKQRLARRIRDHARTSQHQSEASAPGIPGHTARILHSLASAIARAWRGGRTDARPQLADPPATVRQGVRPGPDAVPQPRTAVTNTATASTVRPGATTAAGSARRAARG